ncbi:MAG: MoaD/ThiS family protein [Chloroflexi bacterium]|nr:MoaD/ThiS family protein [Chloroflexota bacterium]
MRLRVKLFASLTRFAPGGQPAGIAFEMDVPEGATLAEVADVLRLPPEELKIAFVNARAQPFDWRLQDGDEIGYFPPVGGG